MKTPSWSTATMRSRSEKNGVSTSGPAGKPAGQKAILACQYPPIWMSKAAEPELLSVLVPFFDDAVTTIGIKHHASVFGRALGHSA